MLSEYIDGQPLSTYMRAVSNLNDPNSNSAKIKRKLQAHFVANCLLGNYDAMGGDWANVLVTATDLTPYHIDNGSALDYSAQGNKRVLPQEVFELDELRGIERSGDAKKNIGTLPYRNAALIYGDITDAEIVRQIDDVLKKKVELLAVIPEYLHPIMEKRMEYLEKYKSKLLSKPAIKKISRE
jgi:hypothetical protein